MGGVALNVKIERTLLPLMFRAIQHNSTRSYLSAMAALETGVKRMVDVVCLQEPLQEGAGIGINWKHTTLAKE